MATDPRSDEGLDIGIDSMIRDEPGNLPINAWANRGRRIIFTWHQD